MSEPNFYEPGTITTKAPKHKLSKEVAGRMSVAELRETAEFQQLTEKQKLFVETYCEAGLAGNYDLVAATMAAYKCKSLDNARVMSYSMKNNIRIIAVLNRHFGTTPIEAFMTMVDKAITNKHLRIAQVQALRLKCDLLGYPTRLPVLTVPKDVIEEAEKVAKANKKPYSKRKPAEKSDLDKSMDALRLSNS